ncbi:MAG TPA: hypothetical protein VNO33_13305, partial [Kofleriaceae bacterium]|nr:hypothetical protein [Kofleriaceae bacterium]
VDWATGDEIGAIDAGGPAHDAELDSRRGLLRVARPGQVWLYRASPARGFRGPILLGDNASRSGFLTSGAAALWTIDQSNQLRTYRLDELERGLGREQSQARGVAVEHATLAVDRQGRFYAQSTTSGGLAIERFSGPRRADLERSFDFPTPVGAAIYPSPDGARVAFARGDGVLTVFAAGPDTSWSRSLIASHSPVWSADGALLAVPGRQGAVVLDAATGAQVDLTCGPWFEVRRTLPPLRHVSQPQPSVCESAP